MSSIIQTVVRHFAGLKPRVFVVPEWDGVEVHAAPVTLRDRQELAPFEGKPEFMARLIVLKAQDAAGKPLFQPEDRHDLFYRADAAVVERVAAQILGQAEDPAKLGEPLRREPTATPPLST